MIQIHIDRSSRKWQLSLFFSSQPLGRFSFACSGLENLLGLFPGHHLGQVSIKCNFLLVANISWINNESAARKKELEKSKRRWGGGWLYNSRKSAWRRWQLVIWSFAAAEKMKCSTTSLSHVYIGLKDTKGGWRRWWCRRAKGWVDGGVSSNVMKHEKWWAFGGSKVAQLFRLLPTKRQEILYASRVHFFHSHMIYLCGCQAAFEVAKT